MIKSIITDPSISAYTHIDVTKGEKNALIVANRELKELLYTQRFFLNPTYGIEMNQNGSIDPTGDVELIYDENIGTPNEWDMSVITGSWIFNSTTHPYSGTYCIDATGSKNGHVCEANLGSDFNTSIYTILTGHIYIEIWNITPTHEILAYGWDSVAGVMVGTPVNIGDYVNIVTTNVWQKFIIPLDDMNLSGKTIDSIRFQNVKIGGDDIDFYLDRIEFEGSPSDTTGILEYTIEPDQGSWLYICALNMIFVDEYDSTLANSTMPKLPYDSLLGVPELENGILIQVKSGGVFLFTNVFRTLFDFLSLTPMRSDCYGSDGTYTWFKMCIQFVQPIILKSEEADKILFTIQDDLSQFVKMRSSVCCRIENR